ncbi:conserved hypothetical protein [Cupriavidus necator]|uniref:Uncharacterized protein n=1 Tax=Cupriavidus necator TaxID=106590 RepID=A0A1K0INM7_CUPNE|nr:conserved hypothetical protein [Cupriavidus necator]
MSDETFRRVQELQDAVEPIEAVAKRLGATSVATKLLEQSEAQRQLAKMADIGGAAKLAEISAVVQRMGATSVAAKLLEQSEAQRQTLAKLADIGGVATMLQEFECRLQFDSRMGEATRMALTGRMPEIGATISAAMDVQRRYAERFRLPKGLELRELAHEAMERANASVRAVFETEQRLQSAMEAMHSPWLHVGASLASATAFSEIVALGRALEQQPAFGRDLTEALRSGLGDWRDPLPLELDAIVDPVRRSEFYVERGFDTDLTDFTPVAFDESLQIAGLRNPVSAESDVEQDRAFARSEQAYNSLLHFEIRIRLYIEHAMLKAFGGDWMKRQLPPGMFDLWIEKRDKAVKAGQPEQTLISYADFTDYVRIIERKDNWNMVFKAVFRRVEDVRESFQRLYPVRISTMHARFLTRDDELLLIVETKRVLKAVGMP